MIRTITSDWGRLWVCREEPSYRDAHTSKNRGGNL